MEKENKFYIISMITAILSFILAGLCLLGFLTVYRRNSDLTQIVSENDKAKNVAVEIAEDNKDWFDYCYDITVNYDEDNVKRYKISFLYSVIDDSSDYQTVYLVYLKDNRAVVKKLFDTRS